MQQCPLKYKARRWRGIEARREEFIGLLSRLEELRFADPALDVTASARWPSFHAGIARRLQGWSWTAGEEELDAHVCACVAVYHWTHGSARCRVVTDAESGDIVAPVTDEMAWCLDTL